jgi:DNA helicase-2/ATP-dependent DNA helicase PcrA
VTGAPPAGARNLLSAARIAAVLGRPEPTPEQAAVIEASPEPLLVVAGAGSGKTETMSARVVWLVANGLVAPEGVLGLTFTRKAAGELAERVRSRLRALRRAGVVPDATHGDGAGGDSGALGEPTVATYHSYAATLVADHGLRLGVEPRSRLLGEAAAWQLATEVVEAWRADDLELSEMTSAPSTVVDAVLALAAECSEHLVAPEDLAAHLDDVLSRTEKLPGDRLRSGPGRPSSETRKVLEALSRRRLVVPLLRRYLDRKRELGVLDFGDQVRLAARIASEVPVVGAGERQRFPVVLLDEYQDTSHAQLVLLRRLFGGGHPVTAVGDPHQSIYGWRGASAGNLQSFPGHFPRAGGAAAPVLCLSTSWRNDTSVLAAANVLSAPLRAAARVDVPALRPRPGAGGGQVLARYHGDVEEEADALAGDLARLWAEDGRRAAEAAQRRSMAVLCRKRSQFEVVEAALRARGLPVEVVGLGGLLSRPEVVDVVAALSVLHDPGRGDALMRLLTGPRWRIGARDLETLAEWAGALVPRAGTGPGAAEDRSIVDALDALPPATWVGRHGRGFSPAGHARLSGLAGVLRRLRARAAMPLPELIVETERALLLDVEVAARPGIDPAAARGVLDRFTDVAAAFVQEADRPVLGAFLAWLSAAELRERGLESGEEPEDVSIAPGDVEPSRRAVQVLTVHAAKGLEWDVVAVPGLSEGTFPARRAVPRDPTAPDRGSGWLTGLGVLPYELRGDRDALPVWHWRSAATQQELDAARERFRLDCGSHEVAEERRLAYVASTRARSLLLLSGAWWADGTTPRRPSRFLLEIAQVAAGGEVPGLVTEGLDEQAVAGPRDDANPRLREPRTALWPADPLGPRRAVVTEAARLVLAADPAADAGSPWAAEVDRLLAERAAVQSGRPPVVSLPVHVSASRLVDLADDPQALAEQIRRPLPVEPRPQARLGTAFHAWLERRFRGDALVDVLDLPGAGDDDAAPDAELARLQDAFEASEWADRLPVAVEVDVETPVAGLVLRGRIDAVFRRGDGGHEVVDWKTGSRPTGERARAAAVQLAVYRLAWARLTGVPLDRVGAAFFYAATGQTVRPADGLDEAALEALVVTVPQARPEPGSML